MSGANLQACRLSVVLALAPVWVSDALELPSQLGHKQGCPFQVTSLITVGPCPQPTVASGSQFPSNSNNKHDTVASQLVQVHA
jgi:hypothetical protein